VKVIEFDTQKGVFVFQLENFETEFHAHPAAEILVAETGHFSLWVNHKKYSQLVYAIIAHNVPHKIVANDCSLQIIMAEHRLDFFIKKITQLSVSPQPDFFCSDDLEKTSISINSLVQEIHQVGVAIEYDPRVAIAIDYLNRNDIEYGEMTESLQKLVHLSGSRLSHLFKKNVGVSLKKYLVWSKLKGTIQQHLYEREDLFSALIQSGFYDQPHFIKSFKNVLGVKPSMVYNSRIVQG